MSATRKTVREQVKLAIEPYMTAAEVVFDHQPTSLDGKDPAVLVLSAGSDRTRETTSGIGTAYRFEIRTLVKHVDAAESWTEEDAEDALDTLEAEVATFIDAAGVKGANWDYVRYAEAVSVITKVEIGGSAFLQESIQVIVRVK